MLARNRANLERALPPLLSAMCGFIGHPRKQLKARACYIMLRMCRSVGASLGPYAGTLLAGLQPLLLIPSLSADRFPPGIQGEFYLPLHFKRILLTMLTCPPHILSFKNIAFLRGFK